MVFDDHLTEKQKLVSLSQIFSLFLIIPPSYLYPISFLLPSSSFPTFKTKPTNSPPLSQISVPICHLALLNAFIVSYTACMQNCVSVELLNTRVFSMDLKQKTLINELTQGRELANQLKNHVSANSSPQECEFLLGKLFSSYEKALSMLNCSGSISSPSDSSPRSENSGQCQKNVIKKRKMTSAKWSRKVRVCVGTPIDGSLDDGYSWRKYGQKEILGAKFPRAYYRCTHRKVKGCLATKQVQKSDEDPSLLEITYSGKHTCIQIGKQEPKENKNQHYPQEIQTQPEEEILFNFGTYLKNEELGSSDEIFPSFSFPSTPIESENMENNYFSLLASPMDNFATFDHHLQSSDSDITDIISAPTSVTNSPIGGLDFSIGQVDFKTSFPFDIPEYFL